MHEANDELFYVVDGTMTFLAGDVHIDAVAGTFLRIPAGITHGAPYPRTTRWTLSVKRATEVDQQSDLD